MAKRVSVKQSPVEKLIFPINWENSLLEGVDVVSIEITHEPPSGDPGTFGQQIETPISYVKSPSNLVLGKHYVSVSAITTNPDLKPEVYLILDVLR